VGSNDVNRTGCAVKMFKDRVCSNDVNRTGCAVMTLTGHVAQ